MQFKNMENLWLGLIGLNILIPVIVILAISLLTKTISIKAAFIFSTFILTIDVVLNLIKIIYKYNEVELKENKIIIIKGYFKREKEIVNIAQIKSALWKMNTHLPGIQPFSYIELYLENKEVKKIYYGFSYDDEFIKLLDEISLRVKAKGKFQPYFQL